MYVKSHKSYRLPVLIVSIVYGLIIANFANIAHPQYLIYAENSTLILFRYIDRGLISFLVNEPVWLFVNIFLGHFLEPFRVIETIAFFSSTLLAYTLLIKSPRYFFLLLLILLLPIVLRYRITGFRQGLAISLFVWAWFSYNKSLKYALYFIIPLIHASFFYVFLILFYSHYSLRIKLAFDIRTLIFISSGLFISFFSLTVASIFGARQGEEYATSGTDVSGFAFIFWCTVLIVFLSQGRCFLRKNNFQMAALVFYLSSYYFFPLAGRIFESVVILVIFSGLQLAGVRFYFFTILILSYFLGTWIQSVF